MSRNVQISLAAEKTDRILRDLNDCEGVVSISLQRGASIKPPGDVLGVLATNEGMQDLRDVLKRHEVVGNGAVATGEPSSLVSIPSENKIEVETNESTWDEMASLLRRETNLTNNYLMAMLFSGAVAAVGLWSDTLHIVIGAMVIAPGFEPIIRIPFGFVAGKAKWAWVGLTSTLAGYVAMAIGAAVTVLILEAIQPSATPLSEKFWVGYWSSLKPSSVVVSLAASAAGAAIIAAHRSVLTAGVMIALALIPALSIMGMGLAVGDFDLAWKGFWRWGVDALCVVIGGGTVFLLKRTVLGRGHAGGAL
jgi:uncharacterized hydrophobic protein (TIGR00271 family)